MAWNYQSSLERIKQHVETLQDIEVEKLVREADLEGLLSETRCRQIYGAHTYVAVSNFSKLCSDGAYAGADYKRLIQGAHIYQREVARIVEGNSIFDGLRVHFQEPKLHALFYRPIDASEELASRALLLQLVVKDFVKNVFNPAFPHHDNFIVSAGSALGDVIGTRNGHRGDRELLCLGAPANYAAKIIGTWGSLRVDDRVYDALPGDLRDLRTVFATAINQPHLAGAFQRVRDDFPTPEDLDDDPATAPSKRVLQACRSYRKVLHGTIAARGIGIEAMRRECPHFRDWLERLEALAPDWLFTPPLFPGALRRLSRSRVLLPE